MQRLKRNLPIVGALLVMLAAVWLAPGCAGLKTLPSVCDDLQTPSKLCEVSKKYGVRIEDIGNGLIIANAVAIGQGVYTKDEALKVMKEIRAVLDNPVSNAFFKAQVYLKVDTYPGLLEVASAYFSELGSLTQMMYAEDRRLLVGFLDQQIKILGG
jgi:hypothetical protein